MIKIFISHKQEDSYTANKIANELKAMNIPYYLGDIIQVAPANSSTFGHTVVVSSMYVSNPVVDPKICSRTSSTSYNKDIRFSHSPYAATNRQKRVVRLDGYYA